MNRIVRSGHAARLFVEEDRKLGRLHLRFFDVVRLVEPDGRNSGGRAIGASSLTLLSVIRWAEFFAAPVARSSARGPATSKAIMSRGNSGAAAARSTIESSTTTPIRVAPPWVNVASFIRLQPLLQ